VNPDLASRAPASRLAIATRLLAAIYPSIASGENVFVTAHIKAALAHADELIDLEAASRAAATGQRRDERFVSDGNEG
jgi:hypothetical protein